MQKMNLILADASIGSRFLFESSIDKNKFDFFYFEDRDTILKYLEGNSVDILFLDIDLSKTGGLEILTKLRLSSRTKDSFIIVMSELHGSVDLMQIYNMGASWFLVKPFSITDLNNCISVAYRLINTEKELKDHIGQYNKLNGMIIHDLRNPLHVIRAWLELFSEAHAEMDSDLKEGLGYISNAAMYMSSLVDDLLDLSKIKSGAVELELVENNVADILRTVVKDNGIIAAKKQIVLSHVLEHPEDFTYVLDAKRTSQILNNLISNSLKFTPAGGNIIIKSYVEENSLRISVSDTGLGIKRSELQMLFSEFRQLSTRAISGEKGTGLGLAICKRLMEMFGGDIFVDSEEGRGSIFTLMFPKSGEIVHK